MVDSTEQEPTFVLGWPADEEIRKRILDKLKKPLPAILKGSIKTGCFKCGMAIWLGPRSAALNDAIPICPFCLLKTSAASEANIEAVELRMCSLDNPASHFEGDVWVN